MLLSIIDIHQIYLPQTQNRGTVQQSHNRYVKVVTKFQFIHRKDDPKSHRKHQ